MEVLHFIVKWMKLPLVCAMHVETLLYVTHCIDMRDIRSVLLSITEIYIHCIYMYMLRV